MTLSQTFLIAAPTLPAIGAATIAAARPSGWITSTIEVDERSSRWAVRAALAAFLTAIVVAFAVLVNGPFSAVATTGDGDLIIGLRASQVTVLLGLLTTGVGLVVQSFASRNLQGDLRGRRFFVLASLLTAATTSVAIAVTLGLLSLSWIMAGVALAALVAHRATWGPAPRSSRRTPRSFQVGDAALLAATALTIASVGEIDLRSPAVAAEELAHTSIPVLGGNMLLVVALLLTAASISRSALVPLHGWLPPTIAAPTPVSALLHAGVVNGAGVLLVRLAPVFGSSVWATHLAFVAGAVTAFYATTVKLVRSDVKGDLAWSTAGQMGFMTVQVAIGAIRTWGWGRSILRLSPFTPRGRSVRLPQLENLPAVSGQSVLVRADLNVPLVQRHDGQAMVPHDFRVKAALPKYVSRIFGVRDYTIIDHVDRLPERLPSLYVGLTR